MFKLSVSTLRSLDAAARCRRMAAQTHSPTERLHCIDMALWIVEPLCSKLPAFDRYNSDQNYRSFKTSLLATHRKLVAQRKQVLSSLASA